MSEILLCSLRAAKFSQLAVGERVHRVDDNRLNPLAAAVANNAINNWNDVCEALPGTGPGGENVIATAARASA